MRFDIARFVKIPYGIAKLSLLVAAARVFFYLGPLERYVGVSGKCRRGEYSRYKYLYLVVHMANFLTNPLVKLRTCSKRVAASPLHIRTAIRRELDNWRVA